MTCWDPGHYLRFEHERTRPAADLAARVAVETPASVIDLGCGPGNSTQVLRRRWPAASVTGLDSSPEMIVSATRAYPGQSWVVGDIAHWRPERPCDVVFSNAALQWLPDHAALVARLFRHVAPGGALAFQIPSATFARVRTLIREMALDGPWASRMAAPLASLTMEPPEVYYDALAPMASAVDLWETEYGHVLPAASAIIDWMSSTGLRPFLDVLAPGAEREAFLGRLSSAVSLAYPLRADGRVLFPFRRTFVIAYAAPGPSQACR